MVHMKLKVPKLSFWSFDTVVFTQVLRKWDAIDDEIWAKAIVMERNKRVAKVNWLLYG